MYYSAIDLLAIFLIVVQNKDIFFKRGADFSQPAWKAYRGFLFSVLALYITDLAWSILEAQKLAFPLYIDTALYFFAMAIGVLYWTKYIVMNLDKKYMFRRSLLWAGRLFAILQTIILTVNFFVPVMYTVDDNAGYHVLPGRNIVLIIQVLMLAFLSCYALFYIVVRRTEEKNKYRTIAFFGIITASFLVAQFSFPYLPLYAIAYMLGTSLLHNFVIVNEKEKYRQEMEEAKKISALKQSMTSLLDNMPVMSFSKEIETGKYIACNQSFADYAKKLTPEDVAGLTDFELFDIDTAAHFVSTDKEALAMDKAYIYNEEVLDTDGNPRQFQTTKLKYHDETGALRLLGMSLDITEMVSAKKENELTKAAYQEVVSASEIYENIIGMLSKDYFNLYYINIDTNEYIEYGSKTQTGDTRTIENRGKNFFEDTKKDAPAIVYKDDYDKLMEALDKENLLRELAKHGVFNYYYRIMINGEPNFVALKATRVIGSDSHIIIGVNNVDSQMKSRIDTENAKKERKAYERLSAFSRNLLVLYVVDPETEEYIQYSASKEFEDFKISPKGNNFFEESFNNSLDAVYPKDQSMFNYQFRKDKILKAIELDGIFVMEYRLLIGGKPNYIRLKAAEVIEDGKPMLVIGIENVDSYVRREKQQEYELSLAREKATKDALTGVSNSHAFSEEKERINKQINNSVADDFAVVMCDINGLKHINDTIGHTAGDELIRKACATICTVFKHSRVFRIGGDEFAIICQGHDYEHIDKLLKEMDAANLNNPDVQVAFGMTRYRNGLSLDDVLDSADQIMYEYKAALKAGKNTAYGNKNDGSAVYQFPEDMKKAYESSALSFVFYQNIDDKAIPILASDGFCRNVGMPRDGVLEWLRTSMFERMHPDDVGMMSQISDDFLHQRGPYDAIFRCRLSKSGVKGLAKDKGYVYIHGLGQWQVMPDGTDLCVISYSNLSRAQEITVERQNMYSMLREDRFYTDPLTGIPNINYFNEFAEEKIQALIKKGKTPKVVYTDIYSMQSYNSQYGIKEGDNLLRLTANTLVRNFPDSLVIRGMDDHFILITDTVGNEKLRLQMHIANRIIRKTAHGNTSGIRAGVCSVDENTSLSEALDHAKMTLKQIDNNMNREVEFFSQDSNQNYFRDRYIIEHFDDALKNEYISVYGHSIFRVETQKVAAIERLARWEDPSKGMICPADFVPVLIKYHQLYKLDLYMFEKACRDAKNRFEKGLPVVPVTINFSRQDFDHIDVLHEMNKLYDSYNADNTLDKSYFIVEITEQDLATAEEAFRDQLKRIRNDGYKIWIDDFGSGYSGISTFSQYNIDLIKFDMELLRHLDDNNGANRFILEEIVRLSHELRVHTLAEGLETEEHMSFVEQIGCELAQGFYYHKPEPIEDIMTRINDDGDSKWICETPEERAAFESKWNN